MLSSRVTFKDYISYYSPKSKTTDAFLDFLIRSPCIDLLDFISEAKAYRDIYRASSDHNQSIIRAPALVGKQWKCLMGTYILPGSPNEINLPGYIRAHLLALADATVSPPNPETLDPAVGYAYKALTEDALIPLIESFPS